MDRRVFLRNTALVAGGAAVGGFGVLAFQAATDAETPTAPAPITHPGTTTPVRIADLQGPMPSLVAAEFAGKSAIVLKVPLATLRAAADARGYDTGQYAVRHPDEPDAALLVYDGQCTHLGCIVGWDQRLGASLDFPDYDEDGKEDGRLLCPCHQSQFDVYDLANNLPGMPAKRPLDVIPFLIMPSKDGAYLVGERRIRQDSTRAADTRGAGAEFSL